MTQRPPFLLLLRSLFWNLAKYLHEHSDEGAHNQVGRVVLVVRDSGEGGAEGHGEEGQLQEGHHEGLPRDGVESGLEFLSKLQMRYPVFLVADCKVPPCLKVEHRERHCLEGEGGVAGHEAHPRVLDLARHRRLVPELRVARTLVICRVPKFTILPTSHASSWHQPTRNQGRTFAMQIK